MNNINFNRLSLKRMVGGLFLLISVLLNLKYLANKYLFAPPPYINPFALSMGSQYESMPISNTDIVFVGSSLTQMFDLQEYFHALNYINRGISGDTIGGMFRRLKYIVKGKPCKIFIEIGINDIGWGYPVAGGIAKLDSALLYIKQTTPFTDIYYQSILPTDGRVYGNSAIMRQILSFNDSAKRICSLHNCHYIDVFHRFGDSNGLSAAFDCGDGLHLNFRGYSLWKRVIDSVLEAHPYCYTAADLRLSQNNISRSRTSTVKSDCFPYASGSVGILSWQLGAF